jgi:predicted DNA binding protein
MQTIRQYLKKLEKHQQRKLFDLCNLTEDEKKLLIYAFVKGELVEKTSNELGISPRQYHYMLNVALAKVECKINELDKIRNL